MLGEVGAIEAVFLMVERDDDKIIKANALWALGNLAWNRKNAGRIGRYEPHTKLCTVLRESIG